MPLVDDGIADATLVFTSDVSADVHVPVPAVADGSIDFASDGTAVVTVPAVADAPLDFTSDLTADVTVHATATSAVTFTGNAASVVTVLTDVDSLPISFTSHVCAGPRAWRVRPGTTCRYRDGSDVVHHAVITAVTHQALVDLRVGTTVYIGIAYTPNAHPGSGEGFYR